MAFTCRECLDRLEGPGHMDVCPGGFMLSKGRCESCGFGALCADCKCYKHRYEHMTEDELVAELDRRRQASAKPR